MRMSEGELMRSQGDGTKGLKKLFVLDRSRETSVSN